jgi:alkylation response protein AidB-like acyl-CoA dehydrogenase
MADTPSARAAASAEPDGPEAVLDRLEEVAAAVASRADEVDRCGEFPRACVKELGAAGLLGLLSAREFGGAGGSLGDAARVVERLAGACGSTAMVLLMHYAAGAVIEAHGPLAARRAVASGGHLSTLAFSEEGSRSQFWVPVGTAAAQGDGRVRLDARKSWVTAAGEADSYVWSSRPVRAEGPMTLWLVPGGAPGLSVRGAFDGLGLRGNASSPVTGEAVVVEEAAMLGADGAGLDIALTLVLPRFLVLSAAFSLGVADTLTTLAEQHLVRTRLTHLDATLADQPTARAACARLRVRADSVRAFLGDTLTAVETGREDATLRMLQVKAMAGETAAEVADGVMKLCGGAAFRRDLGVERRFRDALAARVMAPTTDALYDFAARARLGMPLFGEAAA